MEDLMDMYLKGCSPYISDLTYDINNRALVLVCVNNPDDFIPTVKVTLDGVRSYSEETIDTEYDDNCINSVVGINWVRDNVLCIHTEKKEIIIEVENAPKTLRIA